MPKIYDELKKMHDELTLHRTQTDQMVNVILSALKTHGMVKITTINGGVHVEIIQPPTKPNTDPK